MHYFVGSVTWHTTPNLSIRFGEGFRYRSSSESYTL